MVKNLVQTNKVKRGRPSNSKAPQPYTKTKSLPRPKDGRRQDKLDQFPIFRDKGRCRHCKSGQTHVLFRKCHVRLYLVPTSKCVVDFYFNK